MTTGERIRQARKSAGMTQAELAHKLGISAAGIAQWENDLRNPKIETLRKLADALGVTPGYLLYGDTDPVQRSLFDAEDTAKALKGELQKSLETGKITPALTNGKAAKALSVLENQMWTAVDEIGKESGSALLQLFRFLPPDLRDIVVYYEELNADGQRVARERIEELTQIYKYQREENIHQRTHRMHRTPPGMLPKIQTTRTAKAARRGFSAAVSVGAVPQKV